MRFSYQPINEAVDEVRILSLLPGNFDDPISCTISHESLQAASNYEALSYCWGDPSLSQEILIDTTGFSVTENAACALRYLRMTDSIRRIWIDAVCIDQSDTEERSHQVQQMAHIYAHASRVLAWLGPEMDGSENGTHFLRLLAKEAQQNTGRLPTEPFHELPTGLLTSLLQILLRKYWSRTWIVQEVAVSQKEPLIGCGRQWDSWQTWRLGLHHLLTYRNSLDSLKKLDLPPQHVDLLKHLTLVYRFQALDNIRASIQGYHATVDRTNILSIFVYTTQTNALDPRDYIFALLGLFKGCNGTKLGPYITPDYAKTVRRVYSEMTKFAVEANGDLQILALRNHIRTPGLPSWTPDYSIRANRFPSISLEKYCNGSLARRLPPPLSPHYRPRVSDDLGTLHVQGRVVSTVHRILDLVSIHSDPVGTFSEIRSFAAPNMSLEYWSAPELVELKDALWRTLSDDDSEGLSRWSGSYGIAFNQLTAGLGNSSISSLEVQAFLSAVRKTISFSPTSPQRRLLITADGRVGMGAPECEVGDLVCTVDCYNAPMILRRLADHYEYIGECYVHGIMDGQQRLLSAMGEDWTSFNIQ